MLAHVQSAVPEEACGLLAGVGRAVTRVLPVHNAEHSPRRFRMEPRGQVRALLDIEQAGQDLLGIYHSHPVGPSGLSPTDRAEAAYPEAAYLVWSPGSKGWGCRGFRLDGPEPVELTLRIEAQGGHGGGPQAAGGA